MAVTMRNVPPGFRTRAFGQHAASRTRSQLLDPGAAHGRDRRTVEPGTAAVTSSFTVSPAATGVRRRPPWSWRRVTSPQFQTPRRHRAAQG